MTTGFTSWRTGFLRYPGLILFRPFRFPAYVLDPGVNPFVIVSPFYFYSNLPPFIPSSFADQPQTSDPSQDQSTPANPQPDPSSQPSGTDPNNFNISGITDSDAIFTSLKAAWEQDEESTIDSLCPKDGDVKVSVADQSYNLKANDFYELLTDGIRGTKTVKVTVLDFHVEGDSVDLVLLHTFIDPTQKSKQIQQTYTLAKEGGAYVIREFDSQPYVAGGDSTPASSSN